VLQTSAIGPREAGEPLSIAKYTVPAGGWEGFGEEELAEMIDGIRPGRMQAEAARTPSARSRGLRHATPRETTISILISDLVTFFCNLAGLLWLRK
jgi:hypothetical protein